MSDNKRPLDLLTRKDEKSSKIPKLSVYEKQISSRVSTKCNGTLCLFIRFAQGKTFGLFGCSGRYCIALMDFLTTKSIDVNEEGWESKLEIPSQLSDEKLKKVPSYWAKSLCKILPILLKCNKNIRFVDDNGKTILHVFLESFISKHDLLPSKDSAHKIIKTVQYLMDNGISVQAVDENGNTPAHLAAKLGNADLIEMMLRDYVNINACNEQGDTILHLVADNSVHVKDNPVIKFVELAKILLRKGANVDLQNKVGWTPVHVAAELKHLYMLNVFAKKKPNLKLRTNDGETALLLCCKHMHSVEKAGIPIQSVDLLLNGGSDVNATDANGYSPLHYALKYGQPETIEMLIKAGADLRCRTKDHSLTPLHIALHYGASVRTVKTLLEAGAEIDAEAADGVTPLHLAVLRSPGLATYLIQQGANVRRRETLFGFTLIHVAALDSLLGRTIFFLNYREWNVNDGGYYGITALHLASFLGDVDSVRMLIERGADVHCRDDVTNSTPLHFAAKAGRIWDLISQISGVERRPFWETRPYKTDNASVMALLVENGADVDSKDASGRTPLHLATVHVEDEAKKKSIQPMNNLVRGLLKLGAYVDLADDGGRLPLHNALTTGHKRALKSLLKFGVDVDDADTIRIVMSCKENLRNRVLKYTVKLRAAELPVSHSYVVHIDNLLFKDYYFECLEEVEKMKSHLVDDTTSLYDLLHINWRQRVNLAQSVPADLQKKFPLYWGIIQSSCREALQRKLLLEPAKSAWYRITEVYLPDICVERILDHLKNRYLRVLVDGLNDGN